MTGRSRSEESKNGHSHCGRDVGRRRVDADIKRRASKQFRRLSERKSARELSIRAFG